ncbi:hypothetical protein RHMOL_Rhmol06G0306800 [Rhododendron molle]|uniref:Uncharacterized protein n=2 Tax=Rhododendron molle TaxID=49168 RepID=A0ACC0NKB8_RHOML|nr:hypothetical protein RHMOL_Rhmol06G0306800 [Rhododendron molle]KAI8552938.1 hypothetical protein RHMOL_Rhmol06G0306800 [Rhododendron molle]
MGDNKRYEIGQNAYIKLVLQALNHKTSAVNWLLLGRLSAYNNDVVEITESGVALAILRGVIDFKREPWPQISDSAKNLVRQMLEPNPRKRLTAQQVLAVDAAGCAEEQILNCNLADVDVAMNEESPSVSVIYVLDVCAKTKVHACSTENPKEVSFFESFEAAHSLHDLSSSIANKLGVKAPPVRIDSQAKYGALSRGDGAIYLRFPHKGYREKIWDHAAGAIVVTGNAKKISSRKDYTRKSLQNPESSIKIKDEVMGISKQNQEAEKFRQNEEDSDNEECDSDDSDEDPTFEAVEETLSSFSRLSIKKKSKSRIVKVTEEGNEEDPDEIVPELDEEDQRSFEVVRKIIEVGQVEKLKVEQCKVYLRKHGLRLTGNKDTLVGRIKEHLSILNGGGERKYPISSFVWNCKGDACTGDVVMFEQNVYEIFNIASRSASGPPCGTRIVAGRIVKESYGAAKQQHTFTRWEDEGER